MIARFGSRSTGWRRSIGAAIVTCICLATAAHSQAQDLYGGSSAWPSASTPRPGGKFQMHILGAIGEFERARIQE